MTDTRIPLSTGSSPTADKSGLLALRTEVHDALARDVGAGLTAQTKSLPCQRVVRASAAITPPGHARATYRNFFPPAARWPFTGLCLARDV
jgi:formylglycine-generating enzyme required for sulfatase activity